MSQKSTTEFIQSPIKERKELKEKEVLNPVILQERVKYSMSSRENGGGAQDFLQDQQIPISKLQATEAFQELCNQTTAPGHELLPI